MMSKFLLSIISVCYNNPNELLRTLRSFDGLNHEIFEVIIVDGSSNESCKKIAKSFPEFKYLGGPDTGKYHAMNKGLAASSGEAVLFMNSGDLLHDRVVIEAAIRQHSNRLTSALLYGDSIRVVGGKRIYVDAVDPSPETQRLAVFPSHQSILVPRLYHLEHLFDESMFFAADSKMLRVAFDQLPSERLNFAVGEFSYGGACTSPGSWALLRRQYSELLEVASYTRWEKAKVAFSLVSRKLTHMIFGEEALQQAQARGLERKLAGSGAKS